jgi:hypothetical protein
LTPRPSTNFTPTPSQYPQLIDLKTTSVWFSDCIFRGVMWKDTPMQTNTSETPDERRGKFRFPMQRELRYKVYRDGAVVQSGNGETINIGSGGVWFAMDSDASVGSFIQLSVSWPVLLDQSCPMRLVIFGRVLRGAAGVCACTIDKYEFRTQGRSLQPQGQRNDAMLQRWVETVRKDNLKAGAATTA